MDIRLHARKVVSELRDDGDFCHLGGPTQGRAVAMILARDLARRGHAREFEMIWSVFRRPDRLRSSLAWATATQLVLDFGDRALSHADLLRRHQLWLRKFPKHPGRKSVAPRTDQLERIVAAKRKRATSRNTKAMTVADLIFDLRDEFHSPKTAWIQNHPVDPVVPTPRGTVTPREQLRKVGMKAVPALIGVLEDKSPSRCVVCFRRYGGSFWLLSVGAQAEGLLRHITRQPDQQRKSAKWWREWYAAQRGKGKEAKPGREAGRQDK